MAKTTERTRNGDDPTRSFLWSALNAEEALRRQRELVEGLESRCARSTASYGLGCRGGGLGPEELWARLADEEEKAREMEQELEICRKAVDEVLGKLERPLERDMLRLRYLEGLTWPVVQDRLEELGYDRGTRSLPRLHNQALRTVSRLAGIV